MSLLQKTVGILNNLIDSDKADIIKIKNFKSGVEELDERVKEFTTLKNIENGWIGKD